MKKRIIPILLAICISLTMTTPAFAASNLDPQEPQINLSDHNKWKISRMLSELELNQAKTLSLEELRYAAKIATTDEEATIVFDALLDKYQTDVSLQNSNIVNEYVSVTSITKSGKSTIIKYKITKTIPSLVNINLGYEYPAVTRTHGEIITLTGKSVGSHTKSFTISPLKCQHRVYSQLTARNYTEKRVWKLFHYSTSTISVDYHTVTAAEATGYFVVYVLAPAIAVKLFPSSKIIKIAGNVVSVGSISLTAADTYNISIGLPTPSVGQYYKTETWYSMDKIFYRVTVWKDKNTYLNNPSVKLYVTPPNRCVATNLPTF